MKRRAKVYCFPNGNTAAFDDEGNQIVGAQAPWLLLLASQLEGYGIDLELSDIFLPGGQRAVFFKMPDGSGWNWECK